MLAILFAALTFAVSAPHEHDRAGQGGHSPALAPTAQNAAEASPCPLCEWAMESYSLPASENVSARFLSAPIAPIDAVYAEAHFSRPVLCPNLRGPPVLS